MKHLKKFESFSINENYVDEEKEQFEKLIKICKNSFPEFDEKITKEVMDASGEKKIIRRDGKVNLSKLSLLMFNHKLLPADEKKVKEFSDEISKYYNPSDESFSLVDQNKNMAKYKKEKKY